MTCGCFAFPVTVRLNQQFQFAQSDLFSTPAGSNNCWHEHFKFYQNVNLFVCCWFVQILLPCHVHCISFMHFLTKSSKYWICLAAAFGQWCVLFSRQEMDEQFLFSSGKVLLLLLITVLFWYNKVQILSSFFFLVCFQFRHTCFHCAV